MIQVNQDAIKVIKAHIPSITRSIEEEEDWPLDMDGEYIGDKRECACGLRLDGFYEYVDHLITLFGGRSHIGS